jgi:hypothetical protein
MSRTYLEILAQAHQTISELLQSQISLAASTRSCLSDLKQQIEVEIARPSCTRLAISN